MSETESKTRGTEAELWLTPSHALDMSARSIRAKPPQVEQIHPRITAVQAEPSKKRTVTGLTHFRRIMRPMLSRPTAIKA
jgi:hypothetical protein